MSSNSVKHLLRKRNLYMKNNIILIGFMGVGKGSLARALSKEIDMFAIDTDDLIESFENRKIKKIFLNDGEDYFRNLEQVCSNWIEENVNNSIISIGGGFYKVNNLKKLGQVVYLKSSFKGIYQRLLDAPNSVKKLKKRPLFQDIKKAEELYNSRIDIYENLADKVLDVENRDIRSILNELITFNLTFENKV